MKFDVVIGNPPYQIATGGKSHTVFQKFWVSSWNIAKRQCMIFLRGWQKSTGRASGSTEDPKMREDRFLQIVDNYYEKSESPINVFPGVSTGGVNILYRDGEIDNGGEVRIFEYGEFKEKRNIADVKYWSDRTQKIFDKVEKWRQECGLIPARDKITGRNPAGILTYFTDPTREEYSQILHAQPATPLSLSLSQIISPFITSSGHTIKHLKNINGCGSPQTLKAKKATG